MAYELANLETSPVATVPSPLALREERVVDMYADDKIRIAKAMAKLAPEGQKNDAPNINDSGTGGETLDATTSRPLSPQLAALARKEQKFREEQKKFKAAELALDAERKEIAELKALKEKLAAGDYSEADKLIDYEKLTQHKLGKDPRSEELDTLRSEIGALKADREKDINDRFESAVNQRRVAVKSLIASGDEYSAVKELKAEDAVVQHILDTWENDGIELSPAEAAKEVDTALREKAQKWAKILGTKEEPARVEEQKAESTKELPPLKPAMKTLTNNMGSTGDIKPLKKPLHLMNDQERYLEARRRYEEKLQNGMR